MLVVTEHDSDDVLVPDSDTGNSTDHPADVTRSTSISRYVRRLVIALVVGIGIMAIIQYLAPATDHQLANIGTAVVGLVTILCVLFPLHRIASAFGRRLLVPATCLIAVVAFPCLFEFDGFSGEMVPQFKFRLASGAPEARSLSQLDATEEDVVADVPAARALADSLGFLGNARTAVIDKRLFSVPATTEDVELLWSQGIGAGWSSFSVIGDRAITLEQRDQTECLTCYRLLDGKPLWVITRQSLHYEPLGGTGPRSTPTIDADYVYAQGASGMLWCVDWKTGETKWSVDLLDLAGWDQAASEVAIKWGRAGSPLLVDGLCVVPFGGPDSNEGTGRSLIALDADSGDVRWVAGSDQISFASPGLMTLGGIRQIVSVNEQTITGHQIDDGTVLWEFEWFGQSNGSANCAMVVPAGENRFLIGKGYGGGSALVEVVAGDGGTLVASALWESNRILKTKITHACVDGEIAYAISNGSLEAVSIPDAQQLWLQPRRVRLGQGQLLLAEGVLVAQSESGEVVFVEADPTEYREMFRLPAMQSKTWNIPTLAGRHLLVRNDRQAFCFLLPPRSDE